MSRLRWFFVMVLTLLGPELISESCQAGFVVTSFAGSSNSANTVAMDAALGISGYTIEDFEDTVLISGLTISFEGLIPENKSYTSLPKTFDSAGDSQTANNFWDGTKVLTNAGNGLNGPFLPSAATNTTFALATGAPVVGIGLANFQSALSSPTNPFPVTDHTLFVNGQNLGTVESLAGVNWNGGVARSRGQSPRSLCKKPQVFLAFREGVNCKAGFDGGPNRYQAPGAVPGRMLANRVPKSVPCTRWGANAGC